MARIGIGRGSGQPRGPRLQGNPANGGSLARGENKWLIKNGLADYRWRDLSGWLRAEASGIWHTTQENLDTGGGFSASACRAATWPADGFCKTRSCTAYLTNRRLRAAISRCLRRCAGLPVLNVLLKYAGIVHGLGAKRRVVRYCQKLWTADQAAQS